MKAYEVVLNSNIDVKDFVNIASNSLKNQIYYMQYNFLKFENMI